MPRFYETGYGRKFFEKQLPELIKAIKKVADALEKQNQLLEKKEERELK